MNIARISMTACLLMACTLSIASTTHQPQLPAPDNPTEQDVLDARMGPISTPMVELSLAHHAAEMGLVVLNVRDSAFNPRTDFPKRPALVATSHAASLGMQECCGGSGSWNFNKQPAHRRPFYAAAAVFALLLLGAVVFDVRRKGRIAMR